MKESMVSCGVRCSVCLRPLCVGQVNEQVRGTCEPVIRTGLMCPQCLSIVSLAGPGISMSQIR